MLILVIFFVLTWISWAEAVSSIDLIEKAKEYDGKMVTYEGEVIGDVMRRSNFAWVNVHDGKSAIGLWMKMSEARKIIYKGNYKFRGDKLRVKGVFNRACTQHGGDLDIHVEELEIITYGYEVAHTISWKQVIAGAVLSVISGIMFILERVRKKRLETEL